MSAAADRPLLVTGGAGFIGSALVRRLVAGGEPVVTVDALTYAGNLDSLSAVLSHPLHRFEHADVRDEVALARIFAECAPRAVFHLAAESHVDRSIDGPDAFVAPNVQGTQRLLEAARRHWQGLPDEARSTFRFLQVSTDEVFGDAGEDGVFTEDTPYAPRSPYAASKAAADHLARAWHHTYGLPVIVTNSSNNYGPHQFPEKLIPLVIVRALRGETLPVYGDGAQVRDWLHVEDHVEGLQAALRRGRPGATYLFGGEGGRTNLEVVRSVCRELDHLRPSPEPRERLIRFVTDRPGHDFRYAVDGTATRGALRWQPRRPFDQALRDTVAWYLANQGWWERVLSGAYRGERLGLARGG